MTDETFTAPAIPDVPPVPPVPPVPAAPAPTIEAHDHGDDGYLSFKPEPELMGQLEFSWTLTMREEAAVKRRFGAVVEELGEGDILRALCFVQLLRTGQPEDAAHATASELRRRESKARFAPDEADGFEEALAEQLDKIVSLNESITTAADELTGPEERQIKAHFAEDYDDLSPFDSARALIFIGKTRAGAQAKDAKAAVANLSRTAVLDGVAEVVAAAGKGETA